MSIIIEKEQILNFYSPTEGLMQVFGTGIVKLFCNDGTMRTEDNGYVMPADTIEITWIEFEKFFDGWRISFRHADEDFSGGYQKKRRATKRGMWQIWKVYGLPTTAEMAVV